MSTLMKPMSLSNMTTENAKKYAGFKAIFLEAEGKPDEARAIRNEYFTLRDKRKKAQGTILGSTGKTVLGA